MKSYVLEVVAGVEITEHEAEDGNSLGLAKKLAKTNGRAAIESGNVQYFWADVEDGVLTVGQFDEELLED